MGWSKKFTCDNPPVKSGENTFAKEVILVGTTIAKGRSEPITAETGWILLPAVQVKNWTAPGGAGLAGSAVQTKTNYEEN